MRSRAWITAVIFAAMVAGAGMEARACSEVTVNSGSEKVSGRNIDWPSGGSIQISINPRGLYRTATAYTEVDRPMNWVSKYGSITQQLYFLETYICLDGMNEHGLSVGMLMMTSAVYPPQDSRPFLNDDKWLLYYLDNFTSVAEAVAAVPAIRVYCLVGGHLALHDASGDSAVMEYVDGVLHIYRPPEYNGVLTRIPPTTSSWPIS